ncbi:hypothetical protein ARALYDRAFT_894367 [Arabidopsis lyrata subsp. lyrata]|uniref:DNA topoisomerase (ATP-hydrolyzing) n=1 Tax=Arabidopsis lyrata subsp. lyrata TaxID=81972 RepID=D7KUC8_ARALL|nr:hypothetical protein ARALYDRAFT_894367 [Arabidopsis lyrata subsp. lyrata]
MAKFHNDNLKYNDFVVIKLCTLIPTEGDSAKTLFMMGLSILSAESRDLYGVFPHQRKLMDVKDVKEEKITKNKQIQ